MAALPGEREAALSDKVKFSRAGDPTIWGVDYGSGDQTRYAIQRPGMQFVAHFATEAEARAALALLAMPVKGNA